ncbi:hypothetical protein HUB98_16380 [Paenibacillus barcinonensis]|uniref:Uncharacterized protein n=1 Tax=Paenibacillus barcinonensis TaxID=198119 RepID=A0ABX6Q672_PAEBA|nr:hypothetical protein [Paenibacillus barcinonensis]QKS57721.1 hypothetical protein HUB98_16380 [Paenibacillus barcinonensis]
MKKIQRPRGNLLRGLWLNCIVMKHGFTGWKLYGCWLCSLHILVVATPCFAIYGASL